MIIYNLELIIGKNGGDGNFFAILIVWFNAWNYDYAAVHETHGSNSFFFFHVLYC